MENKKNGMFSRVVVGVMTAAVLAGVMSIPVLARAEALSGMGTFDLLNGCAYLDEGATPSPGEEYEPEFDLGGAGGWEQDPECVYWYTPAGRCYSAQCKSHPGGNGIIKAKHRE